LVHKLNISGLIRIWDVAVVRTFSPDLWVLSSSFAHMHCKITSVATFRFTIG